LCCVVDETLKPQELGGQDPRWAKAPQKLCVCIQTHTHTHTQ